MIVSSIMKLSIKLSASHRLTQLSQSLDTSSCKLDSELIHNKILFHYVFGWTGAGWVETSFQRVWQGFNIFLSSKLGRKLTLFYCFIFFIFEWSWGSTPRLKSYNIFFSLWNIYLNAPTKKSKWSYGKWKIPLFIVIFLFFSFYEMKIKKYC